MAQATPSDAVTLRPAAAEDVDVVAALEERLFGADAWSPAVVEAELTGEGRCARVAECGGRLLGYAVTSQAGDVVDVLRIAVDPRAQRRGIASALLEAVVAEARAQGGDRVLLEVSRRNAGALAFYAGHGFVEIDSRRRYYRDGSDAVVMRRMIGGFACGGSR